MEKFNPQDIELTKYLFYEKAALARHRRPMLQLLP